jgi:hypothetical protein
VIEETIKHRLQDVLSYVDFRKELTDNIDETQLDLQAVKMFTSTSTGSIKAVITDTEKDYSRGHGEY